MIRPFEEILNNVINIYNEFVIWFCFSSVTFMNYYEVRDSTARVWGWVMIVLIMISLIFTWYQTIVPIFKSLIAKLSVCLENKTHSESDSKISQKQEEREKSSHNKSRNSTNKVRTQNHKPDTNKEANREGNTNQNLIRTMELETVDAPQIIEIKPPEKPSKVIIQEDYKFEGKNKIRKTGLLRERKHKKRQFPNKEIKKEEKFNLDYDDI